MLQSSILVHSGTEAAGNLKAQEDEDEDESAGKMVIEEMQA